MVQVEISRRKFCSEIIRTREQRHQNSRGLVPVRRRFQFDLHCLFRLLYVVPLSVSVQTFRQNLNEDFSLRNFRSLCGPVFVCFQVQFGELVLVKDAARFGKADVDARVSDRLAVGTGDLNPQLRRRWLTVLVLLVGTGGLVLGGGLGGRDYDNHKTGREEQTETREPS